jgi:hypothetical protein
LLTGLLEMPGVLAKPTAALISGSTLVPIAAVLFLPNIAM